MKIFRVGGAVRDQLLGLPVKDVDWVVVGATAEAMLEQGFRQVGRDFPVFLHPDTKQEYALARTERKTAAGYTGFVVHADPSVTLEQDLARRDLTINAMAQDEAGHIVDPYHGQRDLEKKVLRHVTEAFAEDPLRVLRVARFAARFFPQGFTLAEETLALMKKMVKSKELNALVAERVWTETERALAETDPLAYFEVLDRCGALAEVFPEIAETWRRDSPSARDLLAALAKADHSPQRRFASLAMSLSAEQLAQLSSRLRIGKSYTQLGELARKYVRRLHQFTTLEAEERLQLLASIDVFRHPHRVDSLLALARCDWRLQHPSSADYQQAESVLDAVARVAAVSSGDLQAKGLTGLEMAKALRAKRIEALEES